MSRKDYIALASAISAARGAVHNATRGAEYDDWAIATDACNAMVYAIATTLADDNPRFDRNRFLAACGVKD